MGDTEVCQKFNENKCDPLFSGIDAMEKELAEPPEYEQVTYDQIQYEPDPDLTFDPLPVRENVELEKAGSQEALNNIQDSWLTSEKHYEQTELVAGLTLDLHDQICDNIEKVEDDAGGCIMTPLGCKNVPKVATHICRGFALAMKYVWLAVLPSVQAAYIQWRWKFDKDTLGPSEAYDVWVHAKNTANHLKIFDKWSVEALRTINKNVHDQHKEIRSQLQSRHTLMENHINTLTTKYTNHLGDYTEQVADMIYQHHQMLSEKIGVTSTIAANPGLEDVSMPPTTSPPPSMSPPTHSLMLKKPSPNKTKNEVEEDTDTIAKGPPETELHKLKLPPTLDMQWPKGHSTLWELIYNEVGNYVEEVGTSLLAALGADVVTTDRRLAGTSERHFEMEVKWPNGGKHILENAEPSSDC